jgi:hypothetical protein
MFDTKTPPYEPGTGIVNGTGTSSYAPALTYRDH